MSVVRSLFAVPAPLARRFVSHGLDAALAGRFRYTNGTRTLALLSDHKGSTVGAVRADGVNEVRCLLPRSLKLC